MSERISDERLAELVDIRAALHKDYATPTLGEISDMAAELAVFREREAASRDTMNLQIVNGWLVERGAYPVEYPAGAAYGSMPYSDAEPLIDLKTLDGWPGEAEQDHADESVIAKVAAQRAVRIAELEALVDSLDRQIEARSGKTAAERIWCERAREAEAKLAKVRVCVETLSAGPPLGSNWVRWADQAIVRLRSIMDGES